MHAVARPETVLARVGSLYHSARVAARNRIASVHSGHGRFGPLTRAAGATVVLLSLFAGFIPSAFVAAAALPQGAAIARATAAASPQVVARRPCPASRFTCITLRVPRDHFAPAGGPTFDVTFALQRATRSPRKGVFVTITGGPGTSGISVADGYTDALDPRIPAQYDIVFIDQRGVGMSRPLQCPNASLEWYTSDTLPTLSDAQAVAYAGDARRYANRCVAETGIDPNLLPYFSTRQAVEDLEAIRRWLRAERLDLYGESYGTQYVQTYAALHPDRIHALFVDGPVDLTLSGTDFYAEQVRAFDETLRMTLNVCSRTPACRRDLVGDDALAVYDRTAARLARGPRQFDFVKASGRGSAACALAGRPGDGGRRLRVFELRPDAAPAGHGLGVAGRAPAARPAPLCLARPGSGDAGSHRRPLVLGRHVLRRRVHGLRVWQRHRRGAGSRLPGGGQRGWRGVGSTRQHLLRGPAVRLSGRRIRRTRTARRT